ncbi:MAG: hypothetical protein CTY31_00240 [Hyphomicrobium sp.]|nr:MAG: hypothetical protein CTY39_12550 [Hyphomicrobium sp.]PPD01266.1 MAG: hypothetical protein CTY31_00240 [Hyphomicrobium sp.]
MARRRKQPIFYVDGRKRRQKKQQMQDRPHLVPKFPHFVSMVELGHSGDLIVIGGHGERE